MARLNLSMASPALRESGVLNAAQLGFIGSAFSVIYSCGRLFNGILGDRLAPKVMILTDDATAEIDRYGQLLTEGGCWHVTIPLVGKRPPSPDYRFGIMQDLKDKDFKEELENHLVATYGAEFDKWCESHDKGQCCAGCEFGGPLNPDGTSSTCFMRWYEKYKKPERDKEKKENG
jgi:hypothetical protein